MRALSLLLALALVPALARATSVEDTYRHDAPGRVVAIGDVHGARDALVKTLRAAGLVDAQLRWSGGDATLVSVGDLLDRGPDARGVLDLLMRLETEAQSAGGRVHVLSGNHELMILAGEQRDATVADFAAFASDEQAGERDTAFERWRAAQPATPGGDEALRAEFDRRFPPGWFAHRRAFARDGHYGRWLLSHPIAIAVGDTAFVHGGFSPAMAGMSLAQINRAFHDGVNTLLVAVSTLEAAGWIDFSVPGELRDRAVDQKLKAAGKDVDATVAAAAKTVLGFDASPLFGVRGPLWYRGLAMCRAVTEHDVADAALKQFGVKRIAIGHTTTPTLRPTLRLEDKVLMLDTGMLKAAYGGRGHAVTIDAQGLTAIDEDGSTVALVRDERPIGIPMPGNGNDASLEAALASATLPSQLRIDGERTEVALDFQGKPLSAWFFPDRKGGGRHTRELAAYRLDRLLGLGLVPVTIARELDGKPGALQWHPAQLVDSAEAAKGSSRIAPWCDGNPQVQLMYAWDALIFNEGRTAPTLNWEPGNAALLSSDHRRAFNSRQGMPPHLEGQTLQIGPTLCKRLAALDADSLAKAVGDALSKSEQAALLKRRDRMVSGAGCKTAN